MRTGVRQVGVSSDGSTENPASLLGYISGVPPLCCRGEKGGDETGIPSIGIFLWIREGKGGGHGDVYAARPCKSRSRQRGLDLDSLQHQTYSGA